MGCTRVPTWKIKYIWVIAEETYHRLLQGSSAGQAVRPVGLCRSFVHVQVGAPRWPLMARPGAHGGYKPAARGWMRTVAGPPGSARAHAPSGGGPRVSVAPACHAGARDEWAVGPVRASAETPRAGRAAARQPPHRHTRPHAWEEEDVPWRTIAGARRGGRARMPSARTRRARGGGTAVGTGTDGGGGTRRWARQWSGTAGRRQPPAAAPWGDPAGGAREGGGEGAPPRH